MRDRATMITPATPGGAGMAFRLAAVLVAGLLLRSLHPGQPIVENYVGRQTPTAMVARNIERGSGFLRPQLDTAPLPNYFAVEPPIYQELVVKFRMLSGLPLDVSGRMISALATTMAAWGVYALMLRRAGEPTALAAAAAFSMLPLTIRYGRAFQPDALMIGASTAGLACWDAAFARGTNRRLMILGWLLLALGLSAKATAVYIPAAAFLAVFPRRDWRSAALCASTILPVLAWYAWAASLSEASASRASTANRDIWMGLVGFEALSSVDTWRDIVRFLFVRAFTPLGILGALWGLRTYRSGPGTALWWTWGGLATATMALLAAKLHHEYYWLCLAPVAAAGLGLAWSRIDAWRPGIALCAGGALAALSLYASDSTWETPEEWEGIPEAARAIAESTRKDDWIVAPEALLYHADRRGCRLEYTLGAATRAAAEWGPIASAKTPAELIEFYRSKGARWIADVGAEHDDVLRVDLHDWIRRRYKVVIDRPDILLAELPRSEPTGHGE